MKYNGMVDVLNFLMCLKTFIKSPLAASPCVRRLSVARVSSYHFQVRIRRDYLLLDHIVP